MTQKTVMSSTTAAVTLKAVIAVSTRDTKPCAFTQRSNILKTALGTAHCVDLNVHCTSRREHALIRSNGMSASKATQLE